jgi:hypothetical protein
MILSGNHLAGQHIERYNTADCPQEKIEVHLAQESLFSGEILWFKIYITSSLFPDEELSSLVFIELVNSENASILRKKVLIDHGEAPGELEIPDNLPTGIYYILAYTNWMKNFGELTFFSKKILIINPDQPLINTSNNPDSAGYKEAAAVINVAANKLQVYTDKKKYSTREKVTLKIETNKFTGKVMSGDFSVSVSRKEPKMIFLTKNSPQEIKYKDPEKIIYLPDYNGIRLTGKIEDPSGNIVAGAFVTESTPSSGTDIKSNIADSNGKFHFMLKPEEGEREIVITLPDGDTKMRLEESFWNGFRDQHDNPIFSLDGEAISYLREKFAQFQLQNMFKQKYATKKIPERNLGDSSVFYSKPYQLIEFGNYINLDSLREYFYELVPSVKFTRRRGEFLISVIDPVTMETTNQKPGIFLDGVLYDNFEEIANIPVRELDWMIVLPATYYYKDFTFGGIIDIHTKKSDFNSVKLLPNMTRFVFPMADASEWKFLSPHYSIADSLNRIPDFRYLLHWEPDIRIEDSGAVSVQFYTGDVTGNFIIKVAGISADGEHLQTEEEIYVDYH